MQVELTPEVEALINALIASGRFATPAEAVNTALRLFLDPPEAHRRHEELKAMIREGVESADRGELYDLDEVCDQVLREIEQVAVRSQ